MADPDRSGSSPGEERKRPLPFAGRRVAIVHDWLTGMRGGEWCLDLFCELLPEATLFTLVHHPGRLSGRIESMEIRTSFIERLPGAGKLHQKYLPLFPKAVERFDLESYDFVLSSSHCVAKGAVAPPGTRHVCYCHTPMRYIWEFFDDYFAHPGSGLLTRAVMPAVARYLRRWDVESAPRVDRFVANSAHVAGRIRSIYGREAEVIHPPVDLTRFRADRRREDYYLILSALVPYKKVALAVEAFRDLGERLVVVGRGPEMERLRSAAGKNTTFLGWAGDEEVADLLARARALLFPGNEDFGIVPLEAMASGCPVIAYAAGGALETVVPERTGERAATGLFFERQDAGSLAAAVRSFDPERFDPQALREHAALFDLPVFRRKIRLLLDEEEKRARS